VRIVKRISPRNLAPALGCLLAISVGCSTPSPDRGGFASATPAARTAAVTATVRDANRTGRLDRADLEGMVGLLMADDDLIRFMAISGLEELTGRTEGYRFYDRPAARHEATLRWRTFAETAREGRPGIIIEPPPPGADAMVRTEDGGATR